MDFVENIRDIHIGRIIQEKLKEKSMTITDFAALIHKDRTTVNHIFTRKSLDTELLIAISKALDYDLLLKVYYGEEPSPTLYITVKTTEEEVRKLNLPKEFMRLLKNKKTGR